MLDDRVLTHHQDAAFMWSQGGRNYDQVSFAISDALAHAAQRLNPQPGQEILDIATGTGWSARNVARAGARVTGVDIATDLLDAAKDLSRGFNGQITYELADAERLPFPDKRFDGIISTFGVMFAFDQQQAAAEMARVCRPGGRLVIAAWVPGGAVDEFFGLLGGYSDAPPPPASPLNWGDPDKVSALLGKDFDLTFERGQNNAYHHDCDAIWDWYQRGFGPLRLLADGLDADRRAALKRDVDAYHRHYETDAGLRVTRDYLVIIGTRR
jgi:SAM-dependent methyltransferase